MEKNVEIFIHSNQIPINICRDSEFNFGTASWFSGQNSAVWTITGGKAYKAGGVGTLLQQNLLETGKRYRIFTKINDKSDTIRAVKFQLGGSTSASEKLIYINGEFVFDLTAVGNFFRIAQDAGPLTYNLSYVRIYEITDDLNWDLLNHNKLDLYEDEPIEITHSLNDVFDILSRQTTFSKQFKIPSTSNNNKILNYWFDLTSDSSFDTRKILPCIYKSNNISFTGHLRLASVDIIENNPIEYSMEFYGGLLDIKFS